MTACVEEIDHSRVKVEEHKRKVVFLNLTKQKYKRGRIDNCLVKEGIRADYFVSGEGKTVLVELKGCNVAHACKQLLEAVQHDNVRPHLVGKLGFLVLCSRYPSHTTSIQLAMDQAKKKHGAKLIILTKERELTMSDF